MPGPRSNALSVERGERKQTLTSRKNQKIVFLVGALSAATACSPGYGLAPDYGSVIQPLLAEHCYACHGPDAAERKAGLRLDRREVATGELASGARAIVPGDPGASAMVRRLFSDDPDEVMPPPEFRKRPTAAARALLREWVAAGAPYRRHWSFEPVEKPALPEVKDAGWPRNAIDYFILARQEAAGLEPSPEAGRAALVRRLSLDLRGLPPSLGELAEFTAGEDAEAAYARAVDAMLGSPHYGERMAQDWLDLARYGDTNGYHSDSDRAMWLYRDYVIDAFNRNKPYDRFIVENLAGDLLPGATEETRIASGFNRCVTFNEEGGADPDEFYVTYAVDRTNTAGQVFLGLTLGCAQCHDHKYDPISQRDYYQLFAFFNSVEGEIGAGGRNGYHNKPLPPLLKVTPQNLKERIAAIGERIAAAKARLAVARNRPEFSDRDGALGGAARAWAAALGGAGPAALEVTGGLRLHLDAAEVETTATGPGPPVARSWKDLSGHGNHAAATGEPRWLTGAEGLNGRPVVRLDGVDDFFRTTAGAGALGGDFTMVAVLRFHRLDAHQMALMWGEEARGKRRALWKTDKNKLSFNGYHADVVGGAEFRKDEPAVAIVTQEGADNLTRFSLNGHPGGEGRAELAAYDSPAITVGANNAGREKTAADFAEILVFDRALDAAEQAALGRYLGQKYAIATAYQPAPPRILALAAKPADALTAEEAQRLFDHFVAEVHPASRDLFRSLEGEIARLEQERDAAVVAVPTTMVMVEMKERRPAHVLLRGDFQQPGARVEPAVPAIFPPLPAGEPRNRLGLARWLTDPRHPLVARVTVNRLWEQLFGTGLVKTLGDFGTQGERPSHPALLDWLAADFVEHGWDVKRLQRMMVSSATYRQSSVHRPGPRHPGDGPGPTDPANRLLSRAPRFRLPAEGIRDAALAVSGLLNREIGGPSVMPPQPDGYLSSIGKGWKESAGADRHRRGLYTFWRRTMLYPTFQIFDAPSREVCAVDRPRTNTPLQALVTLNDPAFVEAASAFGRRVLGSGGDDRAKLAHAFRSATARHPTPAELAVLAAALEEQRQEYRGDADAAGRLAGKTPTPDGAPDDDVAEHAAWVAVAQIILNLDEVITRE